MKPIDESDLEEILEPLEDAERELGRSRVLITGGTGFFGTWLLESWAHNSDRLALERTAVVVTRDPEAFAARMPHLALHRSIELIRGDVLGPNPVHGSFDACLHAATAASLALTQSDPRLMFDTIVDGTRNVLDWVRPSGRIPTVFTSSGAVYGALDPNIEGVPETTLTGPDPLDSTAVYAEAKRAAEMLCAIETATGQDIRVARCFAFVGPHLPLDAHFAVGNFIADGLAGRPIVIHGDGTPVRSYMYGTDLVIWLRTLLARGVAGRSYNVGSEDGRSLAEIARLVGDRCGVDVVVRSESTRSGPSHRYVPSTGRARAELGLKESVLFDEALRRTIVWNRLIT
jgi:dTDP-glucose 4,6-dehydratase